MRLKIAIILLCIGLGIMAVNFDRIKGIVSNLKYISLYVSTERDVKRFESTIDNIENDIDDFEEKIKRVKNKIDSF